ncbi:hypothetical protein [Actinoplanes derwentensis]|uniref:Uncharacterized protein n=1 Tax=Actinoplanes derwentensis TaxID=113562 RepID=A0A1H1Z0U6_9ACTN|nr:hypothetical protein [Actinoplanes derwentensis]GID81358.1 hypothetical protein Ade03nite_02820 [Actinoplanes derwentensis]SDT26796.1 hypothetical protein SAMN04489716_3065 [Actinoplanes derwentensis]
MGGFILGAVITLFVGMRLARLIDGNKSAREAHQKAKATDVSGARKKASSASFALARFVVLLTLAVAVVLFGVMSSDSR